MASGFSVNIKLWDTHGERTEQLTLRLSPPTGRPVEVGVARGTWESYSPYVGDVTSGPIEVDIASRKWSDGTSSGGGGLMLYQWKSIPARQPYSKTTAKSAVLFLVELLPDKWHLRAGDSGGYQARPLESDYVEYRITNVF
jgi:hypothetical protein